MRTVGKMYRSRIQLDPVGCVGPGRPYPEIIDSLRLIPLRSGTKARDTLLDQPFDFTDSLLYVLKLHFSPPISIGKCTGFLEDEES